MLAPAALPEHYLEWNLANGAPFGRRIRGRTLLEYLLPTKALQLRGPFSIQKNNTTREFEYPWAFFSGNIKSGMRVLDLGGGLSGFQFILDRKGCDVVNVDPGMDAEGMGWPCDPTSMKKLNHLFGTSVQLRNTTVEKAQLQENAFDRAFSISVVEHLSDTEMSNAMKQLYLCLKPGGLFILTIDLFLNLHPFCSRSRNEYGQNRNVRWIVESNNWELIEGNRGQLYGFPEFNVDHILSNLEKYLIGHYYPVLVQCLVLRKSF